jgi:hypothetical protein
MRVLAAHLDGARKENGLFSLRNFLEEPGSGVLVVSTDSDYGLVQDPMNAVLFLRLVQLLDKGRNDPRQKVFIVIDEVTAIAGDKPCPGLAEMSLRLRSRGVTALMTYQSFTAIKALYDERAPGILVPFADAVYLRQADLESAQYASDDLGHEQGFERRTSWSNDARGASVSERKVPYDRPICPPTELLSLRPASPQWGVEGRAKSPLAGHLPWSFVYSPGAIGAIPMTTPDIPEYIEREPEAQRLRPLTDEEKTALGLIENQDFWLPS